MGWFPQDFEVVARERKSEKRKRKHDCLFFVLFCDSLSLTCSWSDSFPFSSLSLFLHLVVFGEALTLSSTDAPNLPEILPARSSRATLTKDDFLLILGKSDSATQSNLCIWFIDFSSDRFKTLRELIPQGSGRGHILDLPDVKIKSRNAC